MSELSIAEAVFLSSLPYRRQLFIHGGWGQSQGPGSGDWNSFLTQFFLPAELARSRKEAQAYTCTPRFSLGGRLLAIGCLSFWEPDYPLPLKNIYDPPPVLFYWGDSWTNYRQYLAIVGTRRASPLCAPTIQAFIRQRQAGLQGDGDGLCIVSGLAYGVDRMAHLGAIESGLAGIAVLGSGIQQAGPRRNLDIITRSHAKGLPFTLVSEFAPQCAARPFHFPRRNRIIAGLVSAVAVIQAPARSGALITARYALDEGRDVLAFDHPIFDSQPGANDGARRLLESGAQAIEVPELAARILQRPPDTYTSNSQQLSFWRSQLRGTKWLGGKYYLKL